MKEAKFEITTQGAPLVNSIWYRRIGWRHWQVLVDMHSKYCNLDGYGGNTLLLSADEYSIKLKEDVPRNEATYVQMKALQGCQPIAHSRGRYNITIVFEKPLPQWLERFDFARRWL